jgi:hypothetical protein
MRWLRSSVLSVGVLGGLAMVAGGCDYDDHDYHHDRYYRERPIGYRYEPYPERRWERDRDWDRGYDRRWEDRDGRWRDGRW